MARAAKLDPQLAAAVDDARRAIESMVPQEQLGEHLRVVADADRLVTHRFASQVPGYRGWEWYVTLGRASRSKVVTVCESGLLPGEDALLAPAWVPWSERMEPEELAAAQQAEGEEGMATATADAVADAGEPDGQPTDAEAGAAGSSRETEATDNEDAAETGDATEATADEDVTETGDATNTDEADDDKADDEVPVAPRARRSPRRRRR